ncbi:pantoate--beta-alanine ligase [Fulvimarina endophytica]|uniref:Pantothenate synthetase n=1 Tax=Fulvimarina endophytica TaxID=2293836 RepID=A0A371X5L0_9HYPH|nr:pantoate--beta-alanine ligase [Fulvimarina endophytica]RFC64501.1 pantoate--beta-alanine ligase [Fulvimarina endophytica]
MQQHTSIRDLRSHLARERQAGRTIGVVPTMGALHAGHEALIREARAANDVVVVSIFVNPTQFGDAQDLAHYPRTLEKDLALCEAAGADHVFLPDVAEMYGAGEQTKITVSPLGEDLIGTLRPGHFTGVATVVAKLLNIVQPSRAYFGRKDFQQLTIIRRMVADLFIPVEIVGVATVRDADGLALSSRNARLSERERAASVVLSQALFKGAAMIEAGETSLQAVAESMRRRIEAEPLADLRSLDIREAATLGELTTIGSQALVILVTAQIGPVLLIDQREAVPKAGRQATEGGR